MPTTTIKGIWLKNENGEKIAPKTLLSQVQTPDNKPFEEYIDEKIEIANHGNNQKPWRLIQSITLEEDVNQVYISEDSDGNGFELSAFMVVLSNVVIGGANANVFMQASNIATGNMRIGTLVGANCWTEKNFGNGAIKPIYLFFDDMVTYTFSHIGTHLDSTMIKKYNIDAMRQIGLRVANTSVSDGFSGLIGAGTTIEFYGKDV